MTRSTAGGSPRSRGSGWTLSPRPSTSAGPPARKNGTSEPSPARAGRRLRRESVRPTRPGRRPRPRPRRSCRRRARPRRGSASRGGPRGAAAGRGPEPLRPAARRAATIARRTRLSGGGAGSRPGRRGACPWRPRRSAGGESRSAERRAGPSRVEGVEAVRPASHDGEGQVELGRGDAGRRREAAGGSSRPSSARRPRRSAGSGPSAPRSASHSPTAERLGPPVAGDRRAVERGRDSAGTTGSCRASTLWSILRRSRKPAWTSRQRSSSVAGRRRPASAGRTLEDQDGRLHLGRGLEGLPRHPANDPGGGVVLDEDGQVAHAARRRGDPLGDLALDHQHAALGARRLAEQPVEDRAGDVVRQVGHDVVGRRDEAARSTGRGRPPRRGAARRPRARRRRRRSAKPREAQAPVELHRGHAGAGREEPAGQDARGPARSRARPRPGSGPPRRGSPRGPRRRPGSSG